MKILNLSEAYKLYEMLKPVFPVINENMEVLDFFDDLVNKISSTNPSLIYEILDLLSDDGKIWEKGGMETLKFLLESFIENKVVDLIFFFDGLIRD